jgi:hypothetical protein
MLGGRVAGIRAIGVGAFFVLSFIKKPFAARSIGFVLL